MIYRLHCACLLCVLQANTYFFFFWVPFPIRSFLSFCDFEVNLVSSLGFISPLFVGDKDPFPLLSYN